METSASEAGMMPIPHLNSQLAGWQACPASLAACPPVISYSSSLRRFEGPHPSFHEAEQDAAEPHVRSADRSSVALSAPNADRS